jgi:hypothetical protein
MKQSLNALFSPETTPHPADLQPFRLLCDALFFYTLPALPDRNAPQSDKSEEQKLWRGYTPVHLSEKEQTRFHSLSRELKGHEAEFHGGLLASLSAAPDDRDEASVGSLVTSLRLGTQPAQPRKASDEALWQAMLILRLAEMFREEQREITQGYLTISDKEAEIFAAIRGEETAEEMGDEEEEQALRELAAATAQGGPTLNLAKLAKAWGYLYTRDKRAAEFPLLVTTHQELQGVLAEAYEALTGNLPRQLVNLVLPTQNGEDTSPTENFRAGTEECREYFNRVLLGIAASGAISAEQMTKLQEAGNNLNRAALPFLKGSPAEKAMRFYAYEGVSLIDLFAKVCNTQSAEFPKGTATATGLLAVLG